MAFGYQQLTISGATAGIEGTAKLIQETKNFMVNTLGWTLTDDRTTQAGTNHKLILQSTGEDSSASTFYLVMTSGNETSVAAAQSVIGIRAATAWSTTTHAVATSGTSTPTASGTVTLTTSTNANYTAWMSGDKNSVVLITKIGSNYDAAYIGRVNQFTSKSQDPFPIYVVGASNTTDTDNLVSTNTAAYTFFNASTAIGTSGDADAEGFVQGNNGLVIGGNQAPTQNIFNTSEAYVALPIIMGISQSAPARRSIRGVAFNMWVCIASGTGVTGSTLTYEDEFTTSAGTTYKAFFNGAPGRAIVIRKS